MHNDKKDRVPIYQHHSLYQSGIGNTDNFSNSIHNSVLDYQLEELERSVMDCKRVKEKLKAVSSDPGILQRGCIKDQLEESVKFCKKSSEEHKPVYKIVL